VLKVQELNIDGDIFRLREPRLADYLETRKHPNDEFAYRMLAGMLIDDKGKSFGIERVYELPLRVFDVLSEAVGKLSQPRKSPLDVTSGSSTGSPLPLGELPSMNSESDSP
jgi:hypothetical protein